MCEFCFGFQNGGGATTVQDSINRNGQRCCGQRGQPGNDHGQVAYKMHCENPENLGCGHVYGANGSDVFQRKCPECQGGEIGIPF